MKTALNWFEIAVDDLDRAARFYEQMLGTPLRRERFFGLDQALFPYESPGLGGALVKDPRRAPGAAGALVFLNAEGRLDDCLGRVAVAGGEVVQKKTSIEFAGYYALVRDTEGNLVGLHSRTA